MYTSPSFEYGVMPEWPGWSTTTRFPQPVEQITHVKYLVLNTLPTKWMKYVKIKGQVLKMQYLAISKK